MSSPFMSLGCSPLFFLMNQATDICTRSQGAAANVPTALGILGTTFPPGKAKNYAFSTYGK